jgi:hypothetical protein
MKKTAIMPGADQRSPSQPADEQRAQRPQLHQFMIGDVPGGFERQRDHEVERGEEVHVGMA